MHRKGPMAQFDVYPNPVEELRPSHPYVLQIQSGFLKNAVAVIVIPLARLVPDTSSVERLNPVFEVAGEKVLLEVLGITSFEPSDLRRPVVNLTHDADAIWAALDYAVHGY